MDMFQSFEEFIDASSMQVPILSFIINLSIAAILAIILGRVYIFLYPTFPGNAHASIHISLLPLSRLTPEAAG